MESWHARMAAWLASDGLQCELRDLHAAHRQDGLTADEARLLLHLTKDAHARLRVEVRKGVTFARSPVQLVRNVLAPQLELS